MKKQHILDILMTIMLMIVMSYQITGETIHGWFGAVSLLLYIIHQIFNYKWYQTLFKGSYSLSRIVRLIINIATLVALLLTGYSGLVLSPFPMPGSLVLSRSMHLSASYCAFVLMGIHLGMHMQRLFMQLKLKKKTINVIRIASVIIAIYGAVVFGQYKIYRNMFLMNEFAYFNDEILAIFVLLQNIAMFCMWCTVGYSLQLSLRKQTKIMHQWICMVLSIFLVLLPLPFMEGKAEESWDTNIQVEKSKDDFVLIQGGTFQMGSPESENWRIEDEILHEVTVDDFYMSPYEVTSELYEEIMHENPSSFTGENLPVENISWLDAIAFCNAYSKHAGLEPVYTIENNTVSWNTSASGYRLPTEAEWEYACRAGTNTPFHTQTVLGASDANFYGHYPYEIENNYFHQENLETKPGEYRETTVAVDSFEANAFGLYNMHGNVSEWVWDYYGEYEINQKDNPTGPLEGTFKVYRGGGWNDFGKNMRSAYRGTLEPHKATNNIGMRLVRNGEGRDGVVGSALHDNKVNVSSNILIAYFSWSGNTQGAALEIQRQTGADLFEITLVEPYSSSYNTVLDQSQHDQNIQARPELANHINNMDDYDTILLGYPNWWASIPMPIASFLEEYDFSDKRIIPFCSHGGGRFGQSITAISKLVPGASIGEGLSIHYSGGSTLSQDIENWLKTNQIKQ